jgi:hypothetical protein
MSDGGRAVAVADFGDRIEAEVAQGYLADVGIPAWIEVLGADDPYPTQARGTARLFVPVGRAEDARLALVDRFSDPDDESLESKARRPLWIAVVGLVLIAGLVTAAVPRFLWAPVLGIALVGFLLWRLVRPID